MKQFWLMVICASGIFADNAQESLSKNIRVTNKIKPKMLEYTFLKMGYSPDSFTLKVNDKELKPGAWIDLPPYQQSIRIRYDFSFAKGWRTGAKEVTFALAKDKKEYNLEFSWHDKWRIIAPGAKPQKVARLKYKA